MCELYRAAPKGSVVLSGRRESLPAAPTDLKQAAELVTTLLAPYLEP